MLKTWPADSPSLQHGCSCAGSAQRVVGEMTALLLPTPASSGRDPKSQIRRHPPPATMHAPIPKSCRQDVRACAESVSGYVVMATAADGATPAAASKPEMRKQSCCAENGGSSRCTTEPWS